MPTTFQPRSHQLSLWWFHLQFGAANCHPSFAFPSLHFSILVLFFSLSSVCLFCLLFFSFLFSFSSSSVGFFFFTLSSQRDKANYFNCYWSGQSPVIGLRAEALLWSAADAMPFQGFRFILVWDSARWAGSFGCSVLCSCNTSWKMAFRETDRPIRGFSEVPSFTVFFQGRIGTFQFRLGFDDCYESNHCYLLDSVCLRTGIL